MMTVPKRPIQWLNVIGSCWWTMLLWPVWLQVMGPFMSMVITSISVSFIIYCVSELAHYFEQRSFEKWQEENKDKINELNTKFEQLIKELSTEVMEANNGSDQATGTGNSSQEARTERTEEAGEKE